MKRQGALIVTVTDNGAGMSKHDLGRLFGEGVQFRANQLQAGGGSGLGLWISKGVVDVHFGTLSATSEGEGLGSVFTLAIPVGTYTGSEQKIAVVVDSEVGISRRDCSHHAPESNILLVVDDSSMSRKVVCRMLRGNGFTCIEAFDGIDCLEKYAACSKEMSIGAILMDFEMPRMNGPTAARELRNRGVLVPIIGLTGNVLKEDVDVFIDHGADAVLRKPFNLHEFHDIISSHGDKQEKEVILHEDGVFV